MNEIEKDTKVWFVKQREIDNLVSRVKELESLLSKKEEQIEDYPNLLALVEGRISGDFSNWPMMRSELRHLLFLLSKKKKKPFPKDIMEMWDSWRSYIANGGTASWPRDAFENLIGWYEEKIKESENSMVKHFLDEHLSGDGPEIDRWKIRNKELDDIASKLTGALGNAMDDYQEAEARIKTLEEGIGKIIKYDSYLIRLDEYNKLIKR